MIIYWHVFSSKLVNATFQNNSKLVNVTFQNGQSYIIFYSNILIHKVRKVLTWYLQVLC